MKSMLDKELISRKKFCHIFKANLIELSVEGEFGFLVY
jgi:hypothetical protein